ncbi:MAG: hypothetical protein DIU69_12915, partial [Bacillota bacterium]
MRDFPGTLSGTGGFYDPCKSVAGRSGHRDSDSAGSDQGGKTLFLDAVKRRNPRLIEVATQWHQDGVIPPNTFVLDLDAIEANARLLAETAAVHGLRLYFMTKQIGRVPEAVAAIRRGGIEKAVAVDMEEARALHQQGAPVGHIGHLVQIPRAEVAEALSYNPEVITVFSVDKARQVSEAASAIGRRQPILLRVYGDQDWFHPVQEGGIPLEELDEALDVIRRFPGVEIAGFTTFPAIEAVEPEENKGSHDGVWFRPTPNLRTIQEAARIARAAGLNIWQLNAPGMTSVTTIPFLARWGVTHGEPGHAFTGTIPLAAYSDQPELPAMIYVSKTVT